MGMPVIVGSGIDRDQSVTDIVQSVALQQTALSHILNAEGEKIQRVVADKNITTAELLAANKSVESMVNSITKLELMLQSKLALFEGCIAEKPIVKEEVEEEVKDEQASKAQAAREPEPTADPEPATDTQA